MIHPDIKIRVAILGIAAVIVTIALPSLLVTIASSAAGEPEHQQQTTKDQGCNLTQQIRNGTEKQVGNNTSQFTEQGLGTLEVRDDDDDDDDDDDCDDDHDDD